MMVKKNKLELVDDYKNENSYKTCTFKDQGPKVLKIQNSGTPKLFK